MVQDSIPELPVVDRLVGFLRVVVPDGLAEPAIGLLTLLKVIGLAFLSGVTTLKWPFVILGFVTLLAWTARPGRIEAPPGFDLDHESLGTAQA